MAFGTRQIPAKGRPVIGIDRRASPLGVPATLGLIVAFVLIGLMLGVLIGFGGGIWAVVFVLLLGAMATLLVDPRVAIILLIAILPMAPTVFSPKQVFGVTGLNPPNVLMLGALISMAVAAAFGKRDHGPALMDRRFLWLFVLPIIAAGLNGTRHVSQILPVFVLTELIHFDGPLGYLRDQCVKPLLMMLFAWLVASAVRTSKSPERFLWAFAASALLVCAIAIFGASVGGFSLGRLAVERGALSVIGMHANELGPMLVAAIALMLHGASGVDSRALRVALHLSSYACVVAVALSFSRTAYVMLVLVFMHYFFGAGGLWRALIGLLVIVVVAIAIPQELIDRSTLGLSALTGSRAAVVVRDDALTAGRAAGIWIPVFSDFLASPIVGHGLGSMLWSPELRTGAVTILAEHPHNAYLKSLTDMGVLGTVLVLGFYVHVVRLVLGVVRNERAPRFHRAIGRGLLWATALLALQGVTGGALTPVNSHVYFWGALGMMLGLVARSRGVPAGDAVLATASSPRQVRGRLVAH